MSQQTGQRPEQRFVAMLEELKRRDNRQALAILRRGATVPPGEDLATYPLVTRFIPEWARGWREQAFYLVASLYAIHPESWHGEGSGRWDWHLGASLLQLRTARGELQSRSLDVRVLRIVRAEPDQLPDLLRGLVDLLRDGSVPIDWTVLLSDLIYWDRGESQRRWAATYWGRAEEEVA